MGANGGSSSNPNPTNKRRKLMLIAGLIEYPGFGLILFETGCAQDVETVCLASSDIEGPLAPVYRDFLTDLSFTEVGCSSHRHVSENEL